MLFHHVLAWWRTRRFVPLDRKKMCFFWGCLWIVWMTSQFRCWMRDWRQGRCIDWLMCLITTVSVMKHPFALFKYTSYILPADGKHCWFSEVTSLSHPDCHHYLLCKPNNRQLSNSTYGCSVIKEAEKLLIFQAQLWISIRPGSTSNCFCGIHTRIIYLAKVIGLYLTL